jgi:hypothetical protein
MQSKNEKILCECINCGHRQRLERGALEDCECCGNYINCEEDSLYQLEDDEESK